MRFGAVPNPIVDGVNTINSVSVLKTLLRRAIAIGSVVEFQKILNDATNWMGILGFVYLKLWWNIVIRGLFNSYNRSPYL